MLAQRLMRIFDWSSSNATNPSTISDEDLTGEVDEPPDHEPQYYKQAIRKAIPQSSLLTQALSSPELAPIDRGRRYGRESQAISFWSLSGASTAELTSDGGMSSRSHSPSTPPPAMLHTFGRMLQGNKASVGTKTDIDSVHVVGEDDAIDGLARRRCIRFACNAEPPSRRNSTDDYSAAAASVQKPQTLKFACNEPARQQQTASIRFAAEPHPSKQADASTAKTSSPATSFMSIKVNTQPIPTPHSLNSATRFHEFASSCEETEPWMTQVPDKTRLLKVDGVLAKEQKIRKLSEEVEAEVREEEEAEELDEIAEEDEDYEDEFPDWEAEDDSDEDNEEDEEEDESDSEVDEEEADDYLSGNESDNEEGFASDSDDSDGSFFGYSRRPVYPLPLLEKPACCHSPSPFVVNGFHPSADQNSTTIDLPDSTDFVCGTFDEDRVLEDAYVCALVEQKRAKYGITPQDIDPSFPSEESDSEEEYCIKSHGSQEQVWTRGRMSFSEEEAPRGKKIHSILTKEKTLTEGKIRFNSPAPQRRPQSPVPKRRIVSPPPPTQRGFKTTPPISRRNSNDHSPRPTMSRRGSRALSPPPPTRNVPHFPRGNLERTKSLPKGTKISLRSFGCNTQFNTDEAPAFRVRGAIDIVKGLEKKRERRRNKLARQRASYARKGEGVEKMRELGLMLGKGKQAQWMISV